MRTCSDCDYFRPRAETNTGECKAGGPVRSPAPSMAGIGVWPWVTTDTTECGAFWHEPAVSVETIQG
jgi:hypothetical protein